MPNSAEIHLSVQQQNAIDLLASGAGVVKVAEALSINRHTITRWKMKNPIFIAALNSKRKELWSEAHERLRAMVSKAMDVMEQALEDGDGKVAVEVIKAVGIYGSVGAPKGSTSTDEVMTQLAEQYAKELLCSSPTGDLQSQVLYARKMLPIITAELFQEMKDNIDLYTGEDDDENPGESSSQQSIDTQ